MAPIRVGCPVYDYQAIDVIGPTDLLNSAGKEFAEIARRMGMLDDEIVAHAPELVFHHIGVTREPVPLFSSKITMVPTTTVDECPELDILFLGGPDPSTFELHPKFADLVRRHVAAGKLLFTNCTGGAVAASTGILDGREATLNHAWLDFARERYPKVRWTGEKKWAIDGNIWTAAGAVAGMDMMSYYIQEHISMDSLKLATMNLDFEPRDVNGLFTVLPKRYDANGKQIATHEFNNNNKA